MDSKLLYSSVIGSVLWLAIGAFAQNASSPAATPPVSYSSVSELNSLLSRVDEAAKTTLADLGKVRVDKWKVDSNTKRQSQADVQSIQRNLQSALPEIMNQLRASPEDLTATFKLYRNLDALYDVFGPVVESAGAFGSKDEYQSLANDLSSFESARKSLADRMDSLTVSKESELTRLRNQVKELAAQTPPPAPKKVIVDDTEEPKPAKKKSTTKKTTKPPATDTSQPAQQNPASTPPQ
jgi:hypothetical protein